MFPDEDDSGTLDCLEAYSTAFCASSHRSCPPPGWGGGGGVGGGGTWVNLCWVCAAGLSEPLPHYSDILWTIIDPILVTFG